MAFDLGIVVAKLGEDLIAEAGAPIGLEPAKAKEVAQALAKHWGEGPAQAVKLAAAETNLAEEVVSEMSKKLIDLGKERLMGDLGVTDALEGAKAQAQAALGNVGGGLLGRLFGKKG